MSFHTMRNKKREISIGETLNILEKSHYGVMSTVDVDGQPYGVPLSYAVYNGAIYFHCATEGYKLDNIIYSDKVCFTAVGSANADAAAFTERYESVVVFGKAQIAPAEEWEGALMAIGAKYSPGYEGKAREYISKAMNKLKVIKVSIDHITGKANRG